MFSICSYMRFFDSFIYPSGEIDIYQISVTFLDLSTSLVTIIVLPLNNFILYLMLSESFVFISTRSNCLLCP